MLAVSIVRGIIGGSGGPSASGAGSHPGIGWPGGKSWTAESERWRALGEEQPVRAVVFERPGEAILKELPVPRPGPGEVLLKVAACGVCGTDHHIFRGEYLSPYPIVGGHELSGTVAALGTGVVGWRVGDRVAADPNVFCGECYFCRSNRANHCQRFAAVGVTVDGGFAEHVVVPARTLYPVPSELSFEEAALVEPVSCVVYALDRIRMAPGSSALVFGAGPMGQLMQQACRRSGAAAVTCVDVSASRLRLAAELGASHVVRAGPDLDSSLREITPLGFDVVVDATGVPDVVERMFAYAKPTAKILLFGVCPRDARVSISPFEVFKNDWEIYGSFALRYTFYPALDLVSSGAVRVTPIISDRIPLEDLPRLLRGELPGDGRMKVVVSP